MKKFAVGVIVGALLMAAIPAAADEITKRVTATVRNDFSIQLDGKQVKTQNAPLAYDGNSYLPVRELAILMGKDVSFKDGVIKLVTKDGEYPVYPVQDRTPAEQLKEFESELFQINTVNTSHKSYLHWLKENPTDGYEDQIVEVEKKIEINEQKAKEIETKIADLKEKHPELK